MRRLQIGNRDRNSEGERLDMNLVFGIASNLNSHHGHQGCQGYKGSALNRSFRLCVLRVLCVPDRLSLSFGNDHRYSKTVAQDWMHHLPPRELWPAIIRDEPEIHYPATLNLATALVDVHVANGRSSHMAIVAGDNRVSYGQLQGQTNRIGHALRDLGVQPGDRVVMRFLNGPLFVATWLAVQKIGAIGVSTMPMLRARELAYIINDAEAGVVVYQHDLLDELAHSRSAIDHDIVVVAGGRRSDAGK